MSNITLLNEYILKLVYDHLKLRDKFAFSLTIKKFHIIFSDYPLLDTFYEINQGEGRYENQFLFKNIVNIRVVHALVDNNYIENFLNLRHLDLSQVEFSGFNQVKTLINHLPQKVLDITVMDDDVKELFNLGKSFYKRTFSLRISKNKKRLHEEAIISDTSPKRIRTPSPVIRKLDKHWEEYILYRSRLKFAAVSPSNFLPTDLFNKFPTLKDVHYEASIDVRALANFDLNDNQTNVIEQATSRLREILIHSVVTTQDNNWIFISQAEIYYHDKKVDDVAQVDKNDSYSEELTPNIVKRQEGKSTWFELCFWCNRFEVVATGGYYNNKSKDDKLCTFLGVTVPAFFGDEKFLILFTPSRPTETLSCIRTLRNYKRNASLKKWCFKSCLFNSLNFSTPDQLKLFESEPCNYISVCSKLLYLTIFNKLNEEEFVGLENDLNNFKFWETLGFKENQCKEVVFFRLEEIKKGDGKKLSKAKILLVEVVLKKDLNLKNSTLMALYNGIICPRVKAINKTRVKNMGCFSLNKKYFIIET